MFIDNPTLEKATYAAIVALAWIAKEALLILRDKNKPISLGISTGETLPAYWDKQFEDTRRLISEAKNEQVAATRENTAAITTLTMTLLTRRE
jgi:hypothetical protein